MNTNDHEAKHYFEIYRSGYSCYLCLHTLISGIYNQAFGHEISGNPLYEGCDFVETKDEPVHFASSSLVSPNPLYGDTDDLPGYMTRQTGMSNKRNKIDLIQVSNT